MVHPDDPDATAYPLHHEVRHSPDGFAWGYAGSGPAELARCLLLDAMGWPAGEVAYQDFKFDVVANWPGDEAFEITDADILQWVSVHDQQRAHERRTRPRRVIHQDD
jgi:hypothetical protein